MVSNDDVPFSVDQPNLLPIIVNAWIASSYVFIDTVPSNKRWVFRGMTMERSYSGTMEIALLDDVPGNKIILANGTGTILKYQPTDRLSLPSGWEIKTTFGTGTSGTVWTRLLVEEEPEY